MLTTPRSFGRDALLAPPPRPAPLSPTLTEPVSNPPPSHSLRPRFKTVLQLYPTSSTPHPQCPFQPTLERCVVPWPADYSEADGTDHLPALQTTTGAEVAEFYKDEIKGKNGPSDSTKVGR